MAKSLTNVQRDFIGGAVIVLLLITVGLAAAALIQDTMSRRDAALTAPYTLSEGRVSAARIECYPLESNLDAHRAFAAVQQKYKGTARITGTGAPGGTRAGNCEPNELGVIVNQLGTPK